ncbi:MAG TPA: DnaD domain protein, partial [Chthonomonadales bacterium]|nr:DnaD domain protein [Chthonomonadales bacterium]
VAQEQDAAVALGAGGGSGRPTAYTRRETQAHVQVQIERPNIFILYEQNIGLLSPLIADELKDAAEQYPVEWIEAAFREAVLHNKRKWSYIRAILRRWETEGRQTWNA